MAKPSTWIVTGDGSLPAKALAQALQAAGATLQSTMAELGMVVVQGSAAQAKAWRRLPGVAAVEADAAVDLGPPGTDPS
ncbi:MAG: hypothetical protein V4795_02595 [Pseudomonadota bacterium]